MTATKLHILQMIPYFLIFAIAFNLYAIVTPIDRAFGRGAWNGQDVLIVPVAWCALLGSPAATGTPAPNPPDPPDASTDAILWRRHERPTSEIYINSAGITFRSAIIDPSTGVSFPRINDPMTSMGRLGDVVAPQDRNVPNDPGIQEIRMIIQACDREYASKNLSGIGITTININLFTDQRGNYPPPSNLILGQTLCTEDPNRPGFCIGNFRFDDGSTMNLYDGASIVMDNHYLLPGVTDRNFPGTTTSFPRKDSIDIVTGHEFGHALSLLQRLDDQTKLMFETLADNNGDGIGDNKALDSSEVTRAREGATRVAGYTRDPPGEIIQGDMVAAGEVDAVRESESLNESLDLASTKIYFNTTSNKIAINDNLFGIMPISNESSRFWTLIDLDPENISGADENALNRIGVPPTAFRGSDVIIMAEVSNRTITGSMWRWQDAEQDLFPVEKGFGFTLRTMTAYPYDVHASSSSSAGSQSQEGFPLFDVVGNWIDNNITGFELSKPFKVQVLTGLKGSEASDRLDDKVFEEGMDYVLEHTSFPECSVREEGVPGNTVPVEIAGLLPNANIHGLFGPHMVFTGTTNSTGGALTEYPIPQNTTEGLHLVTIGVDGTAYTADCAVNVVPREESGALPLQVLFPEAFQQSSQDFNLTPDGRIQVRVEFSKPVNTDTVVPGNSLILDTERIDNANVSLQWSPDRKTLVVESIDSTSVLDDFSTTDFVFRLSLVGTAADDVSGQGAIIIRDDDGNALDGDSDGNAGGNYSTQFVLVG